MTLGYLKKPFSYGAGLGRENNLEQGKRSSENYLLAALCRDVVRTTQISTIESFAAIVKD